MSGLPMFHVPDSDKRTYYVWVETPDGGVVQHHGSINADRALELLRPATVTLGFFSDAIEILIDKHGDRAGDNLERVRDFLARAEEAFIALPKTEHGLYSAGKIIERGLLSPAELRAAEASGTNQHDEGVTMATRKKTIKKAAKPRSAKKKSAGKKAAKKSPRKKAT